MVNLWINMFQTTNQTIIWMVEYSIVLVPSQTVAMDFMDPYRSIKINETMYIERCWLMMVYVGLLTPFQNY